MLIKNLMSMGFKRINKFYAITSSVVNVVVNDQLAGCCLFNAMKSVITKRSLHRPEMVDHCISRFTVFRCNPLSHFTRRLTVENGDGFYHYFHLLYQLMSFNVMYVLIIIAAFYFVVSLLIALISIH